VRSTCMADCWYNGMLVDKVQTCKHGRQCSMCTPPLSGGARASGHERPHLKKRRGSRTKGAKGMVTAA